MTDPRRAEIWLVDFGEPIGHEQAGRRPAVIVSNDVQNASASGIAIVVPLTTTRRGLPSHIEIDAALSGLDETCYATCEHLRSVSVARLIHRIGRTGTEIMFKIGRAVRILLEF